MTHDLRAFGYVNGKPVYSRDEFVYAVRNRGAITTDDELMKFAEKVTCGWSDAGWKRGFTWFYLSEYAMAEPYRSLTSAEFARLKELQQIAREEEKRADEARQWRLIGTFCYADNSVEEVYEDKDGNQKTVMVVYPHGD